MKKVWNITDDPRRQNIAATTIMLFGKAVKPGCSVTVPDDLLINAHKLQRDVAAGLAAVGSAPPADYLAAKKTVRAKLPKTSVRAHGLNIEGTATTVELETQSEVNQVVVDHDAVKESSEPDATEDQAYGKYGGYGKKRRG